MGQHAAGIDGKSTENLSGFSILEVVEAVPEGLAIQSDPARRRSLVSGVEPRRMPAKHPFDRRGIETLKDVADRGMRRCLLPGQTEGGIPAQAMHVQERVDAPIRRGSGHYGQDRKQQQVRKLVELALGAARIRNVAKQSQQLIERTHGSLQAI